MLYRCFQKKKYYVPIYTYVQKEGGTRGAKKTYYNIKVLKQI